MRKIITLCLIAFLGLTTVKAQTNNALSFSSASNQYVSVPHSSSINLGSTYTIEAWVNYSGGGRTIIDKGDYDFLWQLNATGNNNYMGFYNKNSGWKYSTAAVSQNTWTHVAITLSAGTLTFYINGAASGTASVTTTQDGDEMNIGRQQPTFCQCNHFNGQMDELRIWNIARTQSELAANYTTSIATNSSGLVAYYKFDEGTGSTLTDTSSNANNGTLQNTPTWVTSGATILSNDANLSALTTTAGTLSPAFVSGTTSYTASVTNATTSVTVTPTRNQANATIQVRVNGGSYAAVASGAASSALSLNVGSNTVDVRVTAQDATTIKTYTITVTRAAPPPPTITSFTPTAGSVGSTVTITGTNFNTTAANNIVYFGGMKAATPSAGSATSLTVTVPAGTNYGPVSVTNTASNLSAYSNTFFSATKSPAKTSLSTGEFVASSNFSLGGSTWAMTASEGDFNNDGLLDVAVADYNNASGTSIKVFPNSSTSGTINFGTAVSLSAFSGTRGLASADLDGDGKLELISVGTGTARVSIFPNTTSGATISFGTKVDLTINGGAYYAQAADFDGDGKIDIACANNNVVSIFLNTTTTVGSITFTTKADFPTASGCIGLGVGDINGDGLPDLVTGNSGNNTNNMSVLRNTTSTPGSVSFATKVDFAISSTTTSSYLNLADFDGDGKLDVAVSNGNSRSISLFRNTSSGSSITFNSPYNLTGYFNNIGLGVGDINGDGLPDVAAADGAFWRIYLNTGSSGTISFSGNTDLTTGGGPWDVSIADLDGDGRADVFGGNGGTELRAYRYVPTFSSNANLSALTPSAGTITPTFAAGTTSYTASVSNATTSVTVTPTRAEANATIQARVNGGSYATVNSGSQSSALNLNLGINTIDVLVTAQDGTTTKTYTITVCRTATPSVSLSTSSTTVCSGSSVTITATPVNGGTLPTYNFKVNGSSVQNSTSATYTSSSFINGDVITCDMSVSYSCATASTVSSSNNITLTILTNGSWTGAVNSNVSNAGNWCGGVPASNANVVILTSVNNPTLSSNLIVNNLTLNDTLVLGGYKLTVNGTISGSNTILKGSNASAIEYAGSGSTTLTFDQTTDGSIINPTSGTNSLKDLTTTGTGTLTLANKVNLYENLTVGAGTTLNTGDGLLVFRNTSTTTARLAAVSGTPTFIGTVVVENYINNQGRAWRLLSSPLTSAGTGGAVTPSVSNNWQSAFGYSGNYGTNIYGPNGAVGMNSPVTPRNSLLRFKSDTLTLGGWTNINTTGVNQFNADAQNAATTTNPVFYLYVRGDKSVVAVANGTPNAFVATTLAAKGRIQYGDKTYSLTGNTNGYAAVANPFISPVDLSTVSTSGLTGTFYCWNPQLNAPIGGWAALNSGNSFTLNGFDANMQIGQAALVQFSGAGTGSATFEEADKVSTFKTIQTGAGNGLQDNLRTKLSLVNSDGSKMPLDELFVGFKNGYSANFVNTEDGEKFANGGENISSKRGNKLIAVELRPYIQNNDSIHLNITNTRVTNYEFEFNPSNFDATVTNAKLIDKFLNITTPISLGSNTTVPFSVTATAGSNAADRFMIVFEGTGTLPNRGFTLGAEKLGTNSVKVNWELQAESGVKHYELQHSIDGVSFKGINTQNGKNGSLTNVYQYTDNRPVNGMNYYRVKTTQLNDIERYSNVINLNFKSSNLNNITVYPNPVKGNTIGLQLQGLDKGDYTIRLFDNVGKEVYKKAINHNGNSSSQTITVNSKLAAGNYTLHLVGKSTSFNQSVLVVE